MKDMLRLLIVVLFGILISTCGEKEGDGKNGVDSSDQDTVRVSYPVTGEIVSYSCNPGDTIHVPCTSVPGGILHIPCIDGTVVVCQDTVH